MPSDLDDLMKFLDSSGVQTSQGRFISAEDLRKWVEERQKVALTEATRVRPRTMVQAKRMAARDEDLFPKEESTDPFKKMAVGGAITATEPQTTDHAAGR